MDTRYDFGQDTDRPIVYVRAVKVGDLPADIGTSQSIEVGGSFSSELEISGDHDWIAVDLEEGESVEITMNGSGSTPLRDPYLVVRDANGQQIAVDDDSGSGFNSALVLIAEETGTYYIDAGSYADRGQGGYTITVVPAPPPRLLDTLDWGTTLSSPVVNVYFATAGVMLDGYTSEGFNSYEIARFQDAFAMISAVSGLSFNIVGSAAQADFRLALDTNEVGTGPGSFLGYFNPPGTYNAGAGVFNGAAWDRGAGGDLERGGYGFVTIMHELLHGLGLAHPHDTGGNSDVLSGVGEPFGDYGSFDLNQGIYTTMSYNSGFPDTQPGHSGGLFGYEAGPMALDIALLQEKYGANDSTASGDTVYVLPGTNAIGSAWQTVWDTGGTDTIRHDGSADAVIDLRAATLDYAEGGGGFVSGVGGISGGFTIAAGVVIETAIGGSGRDLLTGNDADNTLMGGVGDDTLIGGNGNDRLDGGAGNDVLDGGLGDDRYIVAAAGDVIQGEIGYSEGGGVDTVESWISWTLDSNLEILRLQGSADLNGAGNAAPEALVGQEGANQLSGNGGNDVLTAKGGDDTLIGGHGMDYLVGDEGADVFVFDSIAESRPGQGVRDLINGFENGQDLIDLSGIDANLILAGDQAFEFIGSDRFDGAGAASAGQVNYANYGGDWVIVSVDQTGNGSADMQVFVNLTTSLTAEDFIL